MGFWEWFFKGKDKTAGVKLSEIDGVELREAVLEFQLRKLAFAACAGIIANLVGKCEFRTFLDGKEVRDAEYYLWNVQPNANQNSTAFFHEMVDKLLHGNEVLVVGVRHAGADALVVADSWDVDESAIRPNVYKNVRVGDLVFKRTFDESDVLHLTLNHVDIAPILNAMNDSYYRIIDAATKNYLWQAGRHWKVNVGQIAQGDEGWEEKLQERIKKQLAPFLGAGNAVLPEFSGYEYTDVGGQASKTRGEGETRDIRHLYDDIFDFTARALMIPPVLLKGEVAGTDDAVSRLLTLAIDPICDQIQEEANRKRYGFAEWEKGNYLQVDSSKLIHFDLFKNAANIEKLVGAGYSYNEIQRATGGVEIDEPWANAHFFTKNFDLAPNFLKGGENE